MYKFIEHFVPAVVYVIILNFFFMDMTFLTSVLFVIGFYLGHFFMEKYFG